MMEEISTRWALSRVSSSMLTSSVSWCKIFSFFKIFSSVEPLDFESNRISVECKPELQSELGHLATPKIVSDSNLSRHVRQMALHCNLAAVIHVKTIYNKGDPYASNWLERLRHIKRLKNKVLKEVTEDEESSGLIHDFTGETLSLKPS